MSQVVGYTSLMRDWLIGCTADRAIISVLRGLSILFWHDRHKPLALRRFDMLKRELVLARAAVSPRQCIGSTHSERRT